MLKADLVLEQLKFDSDENIAAASMWSFEDINELKDTYQSGRLVAIEINDNDLLLILNEKIRQLDLALQMKESGKVKKVDTMRPRREATL